MSTRALSGMEYKAFEIQLPILHAPKALTRELRALLEEHDGEFFLQTMSAACDPDKEFTLIYTVILASA